MRRTTSDEGDERDGGRTQTGGERERGLAHRTRDPAGARAGIREQGETAQVRVGCFPPQVTACTLLFFFFFT